MDIDGLPGQVYPRRAMEIRTRRWKRIEYQRAIEAGCFEAGDPVELVGGRSSWRSRRPAGISPRSGPWKRRCVRPSVRAGRCVPRGRSRWTRSQAGARHRRGGDLSVGRRTPSRPRSWSRSATRASRWTAKTEEGGPARPGARRRLLDRQPEGRGRRRCIASRAPDRLGRSDGGIHHQPLAPTVRPLALPAAPRAGRGLVAGGAPP